MHSHRLTVILIQQSSKLIAVPGSVRLRLLFFYTLGSIDLEGQKQEIKIESGRLLVRTVLIIILLM